MLLILRIGGTLMNSIWADTVKRNSFDALDGDVSTDVLVIGGGLCGILCAYMLDRAGIDYVLAEADTICGGVTGHTSAKITSQHGLIYHRLIEKFGIEKAAVYLEANEAAIKQYALLCRDIDCDFEEQSSYVYSLGNRDKIEREMDALTKLGFSAKMCESLPLPFPIAAAVKFEGQAQFNVMKFASAISKGLRIYERTKVLGLKGRIAMTNGGVIRAKNIIVATHFPFINKHGAYFLKLYQHRSYVLALKNAPQIDGMYVDEAENGLSFRSYGDLLLLGGGSHRTGKNGGNWKELESFTRKYYPQATVRNQWATQDCMSLDGMPYIGEYSPNTHGLYVATGFNKWGMTSSMVAAMLLTDIFTEKDNTYRQLFAPSRSMLHPQLAINTWESAANLLTPTVRRCPHLGCALKWNSSERSWDCPCHGSRFSENGKLLDNPATDDLKA